MWRRVIRCTKLIFLKQGFKSYFHVEYLNWWWRYRVDPRDPNLIRSLFMSITTSVPNLIISYVPFIGLPLTPFGEEEEESVQIQ